MRHNAYPGWVSATAVGAVAAVAISGCTGGHSSNESTPTITATSAAPFPTESTPAAAPPCEAPSPTDISVATQLLAQPESSYYDVNGIYGPDGKLLTDTQAEDRRIAFFQTQAQKYGVTVFSATKLQDTMYTELNAKTPTPFAVMLGQTQQFMEQLGVDVELAQPGDPNLSGGFGVATQADLETSTAKGTLLSIVAAYDDVPKEYVEETGLTHIEIASGGKDPTIPDYAGYAEVEGAHDTYYLNLKNADSTIVPRHENYHLFDAEECGYDGTMTGGMFDDPGFSALNGGVDLYDQNVLDDTTHISYEDKYLNDSVEFDNKEGADEASGDTAAYCADVKADDAEAAQVLSESNYHPNVAEDKAETGTALTEPVDYALTGNPKSPVLYKKFIYVFARLYQKLPKVAEYYAAVSERPYTNPKEAKC